MWGVMSPQIFRRSRIGRELVAGSAVRYPGLIHRDCGNHSPDGLPFGGKKPVCRLMLVRNASGDEAETETHPYICSGEIETELEKLKE